MRHSEKARALEMPRDCAPCCHLAVSRTSHQYYKTIEEVKSVDKWAIIVWIKHAFTKKSPLNG